VSPRARRPAPAGGARRSRGAGAAPRPGVLTPAARRALASVELLLLDVDGVLTDGSIVMGETERGDDVEVKAFSVHDGLGLTLARAAGYKLGILTGRTSRIVMRRAKELAFDVVEQGHFDKRAAFGAILERLRIPPERALYFGDDLLDLRIMTRAGVAVTVAEAPEPVRRAAHYVTRRSGGRGAVRELVDLLLDVSGRRDRAYAALGIEIP